MNEEILTKAGVLAEKLGDLKGIRFYYMVTQRLGFERCYELACEVVIRDREGRIKTTAPRYFNSLVMKEINKMSV